MRLLAVVYWCDSLNLVHHIQTAERVVSFCGQLAKFAYHLLVFILYYIFFVLSRVKLMLL